MKSLKLNLLKNLRTNKRIVIKGMYSTAWDTNDVMTVVPSYVDAKIGDMFSFAPTGLLSRDRQFAVMRSPSKYSELLEAQGYGEEAVWDAQLNLRFKVLNLQLLNNLEAVQIADEHHKRLLRSKAVSRKRSRKSAK